MYSHGLMISFAVNVYLTHVGGLDMFMVINESNQAPDITNEIYVYGCSNNCVSIGISCYGFKIPSPGGLISCNVNRIVSSYHCFIDFALEVSLGDRSYLLYYNTQGKGLYER